MEEHKYLLEQLEILRVSYIKLLNDKDVLLNWGKPQLEALYASRIGKYQVERLQLQLNIQALKRKLEIIRSLVIQQLPIDLKAIDDLVAQELQKAELMLLEQAMAVAKGQNLLTNLSSPQRSAELRSLFRDFAKYLHPDVNPNLSAVQKDLWHMVSHAYQSGDVDQLKALKVVYAQELKKTEVDFGALTEEDIQLQLEVLGEGIKVLSQEIIEIKDGFPFDIEDKIKDELWVKEEVAKITAEMKELRIYEGKPLLEYQSFFQSYGGTSRPELN